ncbi:MAG: secondary thiamine-phosphate synthase enzyme YjbQ [Ignavibacteriaceae bacterium]|nr:secondary thiamine-phosphate synthase enzyme YjbQ [Ignavibacteriaceae bacterium]
MEISTKSFEIKTTGNTGLIDITGEVVQLLSGSDFNEGNALIFVPGATAGITTIEFEPGLQKDYPAFFEKIIPSGVNYHHNDTWHDGNGHSHIRASLQGASLTVPFTKGSLLLGTWQQIILIDFDTHPRVRNIVVQFTGIKKNL